MFSLAVQKRGLVSRKCFLFTILGAFCNDASLCLSEEIEVSKSDG